MVILNGILYAMVSNNEIVFYMPIKPVHANVAIIPQYLAEDRVAQHAKPTITLYQSCVFSFFASAAESDKREP